jgi:hypothetical protein
MSYNAAFTLSMLLTILSPNIMNKENRPIGVLPDLAEIPQAVLIGLSLPEINSVLNVAEPLRVDAERITATVAS